METFPFIPPLNLFEEGKKLSAVTIFESTNSVLLLTDGNSAFLLPTPKYWTPKDSEQTINKLIEMLELRSQNDIKLHVKEVVKRGTRIETENSELN